MTPMGLCPADGGLRDLGGERDHEVGRLFDAIENLGELDNTLFIYISGDNGGSSIGDINGVFVEWVR